MDNDSNIALDRALTLARGHYQRAILKGDARLSGADLAGAARSYGGRYRASRENLLRRVWRAGIPVCVTRGRHGRLSLHVGKDAARLLAENETTGTYLGVPEVRGV